MYLSRLILNPRHALVLRALSDLYAMHRLLWQAFPDLNRSQIQPNTPTRVHPLLYRVEPISRDGLVRVLAQSETEPNWNALRGASGLLCNAEQRTYTPEVRVGQWLRYRLRANPIVNLRKEGAKRGERQGLLTEPTQAAWLVRQGEEHFGFKLPCWEDTEGIHHPDIRIVCPGIVKGFKKHGETAHGKQAAISLVCVDYDGLLQVTDPARFQQAIRQGIGPAKGLGFGLLSIARASA